MTTLSPEKQKELSFLIGKHHQQIEAYIRAKSEELLNENNTETVTLFSLAVTDLCPGLHTDGEVTFWRSPLEVYDEIREGSAIRIFQLESSESKGERLASRGQSRIEKIEPPPLQLRTIFKERTLTGPFTNFAVYAEQMNLPTGTEFDIIGFALTIENGTLYLIDGSPFIAAVEFRNCDAPQNATGLVIIENARYQSLDKRSGFVHFTAFDTAVVSKNPNKAQRPVWSALTKLKEMFHFRNYRPRLETLMKGLNVTFTESVSNRNLRSELTFINSTTFIGSVCDFDIVDCLWKEKGRLVLVFGSIFVDSNWKRSFIESRSEFFDGLNIIASLTDGAGTRVVTISQVIINSFFHEIALQASPYAIGLVSSFFDRFFSPGVDALTKERSAMKDRFMLDTSNIENMLICALFHYELVYDESETVRMMQHRRIDLIFPFREQEWLEFTDVLRRVLLDIELEFELFDRPELSTESVSIVSSVHPPNTAAQIAHLRALLT